MSDYDTRRIHVNSFFENAFMKIYTVPFSSVTLVALFAALFTCSSHCIALEGSEYYKEGYDPMFKPHPTDTGRKPNRTWRIRYFGPVGIGIDLKRPGMTMEIWNVEEGSPADQTGKLKKGQIIESINGVVLKDIDPREILGDIITEAEATDGVIDLKIKGEGNVRVEIPVMGAYSDTWPLDCPKSDKIVRNLADLLAEEETPSWGSVLFLLSTGEEKDLEVVRKWMQNIEEVGGMTWGIGYKGFGFCEYYLRTGDDSVLPAIEKSLEDLKDRMYQGAWSGREMPAKFTYGPGTGMLHASGMYAMNFILMAKLCGVEVDERMFQESFQQFYRYAGHGLVPYGHSMPEAGFRDNGKHSGLALALATAAQVSPEGESSIYAKARDTAAMKAFYATNWFHAAHTGGGMGEIWHHASVALMREKRPVPYRTYMDTRRWVMDLSRRHDGSIAIEGMDDRYNRSVTDADGGRAWGTYFALTYTYPRKTLQLWGAPRSSHAQQSELPERPWGNATDDIFQSPEPIPSDEPTKLTMEEVLKETVEKDASHPSLTRLSQIESEKEVYKWLLHPESGFRVGAIKQIVEREWDHMVVPLLKSDDSRLRHAGLLAITGMFKGKALPDDRVTSEMYDLVGEILEDPDEAWWTLLHAVQAIERADTKRIGSHRERLLELLEHESVWIRREAVMALAKIATDRDHYKKVLKPIIETSSSFVLDGASWFTTDAIKRAIKEADREVKEFAEPLAQKAFLEVPFPLEDPHTGARPKEGGIILRSRFAKILQELPEGETFLRQLPLTTLESHISGDSADMYQYSGTHEPNEKAPGKWAVAWPAPTSMTSEALEKAMQERLERAYRRPALGRYYLTLKEDGTLSGRLYWGSLWTGDWLLNLYQQKAQRLIFKTYEGVDFMFVETEDFEKVAESDDWHEFRMFVRAEGPGAVWDEPAE